MTARRPASTISLDSSSVGMPHNGKMGVMPLPARFASRYARTSPRKMSPKAKRSIPCWFARPTKVFMMAAYSPSLHGCGSGMNSIGRPMFCACRRTNSILTACMATRANSRLTVQKRPTTSMSGCRRRTGSAQALSLPLLHDSNVLFFHCFQIFFKGLFFCARLHPGVFQVFGDAELTIRLINFSGRGLSRGNRTVPFDVS